ncbi:MAG: RNA polymerase sigma factor [Marmoricola sp.]
MVDEATYAPGGLPGGADEAAFEAWVRPHLTSMSRLAARLVPAADRDDVVQDALVRAWRRRSTYDASRGSAVGWLLAIVADQARRRKPARVVPLAPADRQTLPPESERRIDVERAIAALPPRQRLAVNLHYFVDLDIATCAEVMRCAEGTVKATLHQARGQLHDALGDARD